jgi:hypothetical protein
MGELHVGTFIDDIGALDCGEWDNHWHEERCPACEHDEMKDLGRYRFCLSCNAGFEKAE